MKRLRNLQISKKLTVGFLIVSMISVIIGLIGIMGTYRMKLADTELYENQTKPLSYISTISETIIDMRVHLRTAALWADDSDKLASAKETFTSLENSIEEAISSFEPTITNQNTKALFDEATELYHDIFKPGAEEIFQVAENGSVQATRNAGSNITDATVTIINNYKQCFNNTVEDARLTSEENNRLFTVLFITLASIILIGIILSVTLGRYIANMISKPINTMVDTANEIAIGNTDVNLNVDSEDEIGFLATAFNKMIVSINEQVDIAQDISNSDFTVKVTPRSANDKLGYALKQIAESLNDNFTELSGSACQIALGSEQVSNAAQALSQGATEQASSIEELSASLTQVAEKVNENAKFAGKGKIYSNNTAENAEHCNLLMHDMLDSIHNIQNSSNEISKIIKVIDDIAFQTNILALNAAVEAARAGTAGKGFAVVADEVRNLASKSADAAKETTALIENSLHIVSKGTEIAEQTATELKEINEKTRHIAISMDELSKTAAEQSEAIQQINIGIEQISVVVQTNSASAEESAASSEELSGLAESLQRMVSKAKIKDEIKTTAKRM